MFLCSVDLLNCTAQVAAGAAALAAADMGTPSPSAICAVCHEPFEARALYLELGYRAARRGSHAGRSRPHPAGWSNQRNLAVSNAAPSTIRSPGMRGTAHLFTHGWAPGRSLRQQHTADEAPALERLPALCHGQPARAGPLCVRLAGCTLCHQHPAVLQWRSNPKGGYANTRGRLFSKRTVFHAHRTRCRRAAGTPSAGGV